MNDTGDDATLWQLRFPIPVDAVEEVLAVLDDEAQSFATYEASDGDWHCEIITRAAPDPDRWRAVLEEALGEVAPAVEEIAIEPLAERDWLEATKRSFPPISVGRFWVHGSHVEAAPPAGAVPLKIDAGTAFGSGEHGSTMGCLLAIDALARRRRFKRVLDMGSGSAILAIAALSCWSTARALACDVDADAVRVAAINARENGVAARLRTAVADGYDRPELRRRDRFDLVLANILAGPLAEMAPDLAHSLAPGGHAVLAGLLNAQAAQVLSAHRRQGLVLEGRRDVGPWSTLVLKQPTASRHRARVRRPSP
ncbi:MAG: 50S ribosomal protein L11 methyltransferase, partial [Alphaproteobacteria bacterium]